jgi:hypothetical protein
VTLLKELAARSPLPFMRVRVGPNEIDYIAGRCNHTPCHDQTRTAASAGWVQEVHIGEDVTVCAILRPN